MKKIHDNYYQICKFCHKKLDIDKSNPIKTYCNKDCHNKDRKNCRPKDKSIRLYMEIKNGEQIIHKIQYEKNITICKFCNKEFKTYRNDLYCSMICRINDVSDKVTIKCKECGKDFLVISSYKNRFAYCSKECKLKQSMKYNTGVPFLHKNQYYQCFDENLKRIAYHRYLMQKHLGRKLLLKEHVHHIDNNKFNNSIDNLTIISPEEHTRLHHSTPNKLSTYTCIYCKKDFTGNSNRERKFCSRSCTALFNIKYHI